jgi:hypothetical protein
VISFRHGRLLLAAHVISIFRVDIEWTKRHLLPLFDWQDSEVEATTAWKGFLWSPRLYRPLIEAFKSQFLAASKHYEQLGKHGRQYATLFTFAALDQGNRAFCKSPDLAADMMRRNPTGYGYGRGAFNERLSSE